MSRTNRFFLISVLGLTLIAALLLALSPTNYRVDLTSIVEIWGDVFRDVDKIGRTVTVVSIEREIEIGNEISKSFPLAADEDLQQYIDAVGHELTPRVRRRQIPYKFHVLNSRVVNAYAVAGGQVYITTGMLDKISSEAGLAFILGHEIAHVDLKHSIEMLQYELMLRRVVGEDLATIVRIAERLLTVSYSEQQEREADRSGLIMIAAAGYSPAEGVGSFERLLSGIDPQRDPMKQPVRPEREIGRAIGEALSHYFATHPIWPERAKELEAIVDQNMTSWEGKAFYVGKSNYRDLISRTEELRNTEVIIY